MESTITINNCNCIRHGVIKLNHGQLNIKFGVNGTGKSTIGQAIQAALSENREADLAKLLPYGVNPDEGSPNISGLDQFRQVSVFNEEYANQFVFKDGTLFDDSFQVFLKSAECDAISDDIDHRLRELFNAFQQHEDFSEIHRLLSSANEIIKMTGARVARTGGLGELIRGNGYGFEKHADLRPYEAYYGSRDFSRVSKWASWRRDGNKQLIGSSSCPFCAGEMDLPTIQTQNESIEVVFKSAALKTANELVVFFDGITESRIANPDAVIRLKGNLGDSNKSDEVAADLTKLGGETNYLLGKMNRILAFKPTNISRDEIQDLSNTLESMRIQREQIESFYGTERVLSLIEDVNNQIDNLLVTVGELKGLFFRYDRKLDLIINDRKDDINRFLRLAGFPYQFCITSCGNESAVTYLQPLSGAIEKVESLQNHLSWGELNAFSLVMFLFHAISSNSDLIILDDPISSFDANKKFAIIQRLFSAREDISFRNKTVLLLTHDSQPLLDYVRSNLRAGYSIDTPINASFLKNCDETLSEIPITQNDLKSVLEITRELSADTSLPKACRVVNMRKNIECSIASLSNYVPYHILSSLVHDRTVASLQDETPLTEEEFNCGCNEITALFSIEDFDYNGWLSAVKREQLILDYQTADPYNKVLIARFLLERDRTLFTELRRNQPGLCKFLNESNHIENDYIFQLDPRRYYSIPADYESDLDEFIVDHFS